VMSALEHRRKPQPTLAKERIRMIPSKLLEVALQTAVTVLEIPALVLTMQVEVEVMMKVMAVMMDTRTTPLPKNRKAKAPAKKTKMVATPVMRRQRRTERT
jgi:hypothetical protein